MRITLVHQAALGDTILLIPLLRALRLRWPDSHLTLVTRPAFGQMLVMLGYADAWASADDRDHTAWFAPPESPTEPNSRPAWSSADLLLSAVSTGADPWSENAVRSSSFSLPQVRSSTLRLPQARSSSVSLPENRNAPPPPHSSFAIRHSDFPSRLHFFHPRPPADYPAHVTHYHVAQLAALNLPDPPPAHPLLNPDGPILFHPGSGGESKCWPRASFLALAAHLARNGIQPTFILGEAEQERWGRPAISDLQANHPTYFHVGLYELAERMKRARLFLGNDAGVTHLAAALGVPTIALFGPSNSTQWSPVGPQVTLLHAPDPSQMSSLEIPAVLNEVLVQLHR